MNHGPQFGKHCSDNEEKKKNHQTGFQRLSSGSDNPSLLKLQGLLVIVKYEERAESFLRFLPALWYFFFNPLDWNCFPLSSHIFSLLFTYHYYPCLQFSAENFLQFPTGIPSPPTPTCSILPTESLREATPPPPGQCTNRASPSLTPPPRHN